MTRSKQPPASTSERMTTYRRRMRAAGLRPVQIWVPDTRSQAFVDLCERQSLSIAARDPAGRELDEFISATYEGPEP